MTAPANTALRLHRALDAIWRTAPGVGRLAAVNHTIVGLRFMVAACVFFAIGGVLAMLLRAQLATPRSAFVGPDIYNQLFTMHGTVMMFLFAIPFFEGFAIYLLPKMLGARDLAFPRFGAYGFWCYVFGGSLLILSLLAGVAPDGGWFMYTPLSSRPYSEGINADVWLLGITFVEISAIGAAVEIIVSILKLRAPGMSLDKMPLLAWYLLVTAFMMLIGFPPLILGSILLELERAFDLPFFDPARGGDPLLWQHLFWLFGHPEVYIIFLPAAGMISTILPVFARREIIGYSWIVVSIVALAFLSFGLWVHHMFTVGIPHLALGFFSAASTLVAVPTAVQIFAWIGTLARGNLRFGLPMLYIMGFFATFVIGGLTGVMLALVPFDQQVHDTHFVVAHLHYVLIGGFVFPMLAALYYWLPHLSGREARLSLGRPAFWLIFTGFHGTFFIMHLTGMLGMPRRVFTYTSETGWEWLNFASSIGSFIMAIGFAVVAADLILQARFGARRQPNPWQSGTLEWALPRFVPSYNFASLPAVDTRTPLKADDALALPIARGEFHLGAARNNWPETLGVDLASGEIQEIVVLPRPTFLPLATALATGAFVLCLLFGFYVTSLFALALVAGLFLLWPRTTGARIDHGPMPIGCGRTAPPHWESPRPPSWWGLAFTLGADASLLGSLIFGAIFLVTIAPGPAPTEILPAGIATTLVAVAAMALAAALAELGVRSARVGTRSPQGPLAGAALCQLVALVALAVLITDLPAPTRHSYAAAALVLVAYAGLHAAIGLIFSAWAWSRCLAGYVSAARTLDLRLCAMWQVYTAVAGAGVLFVLHAVSAGLRS